MDQITKYVMEMALRGVYRIGPNVVSVRGKRGYYDGFFFGLFTKWYKLDVVRGGSYRIYRLTQLLDRCPMEDDGQIDRELIAVFDNFEELLRWLNP